MEKFEQVMNSFSDSDMHWWPFLFLRPEQDQYLGNLRVAALSALQGIFIGMLMNIVAALQGNRVNVFVLPTLTTLGTFIVLRATVAWCWNRRADRLRPRVVTEDAAS